VATQGFLLRPLAFATISIVAGGAPLFAQGKAKPGSPAQNPQPDLKSVFQSPPVEEDAQLVERINKAIARGERWLTRNQGREGSFQNEERSARIGYTELALYALASGSEVLSPERLKELAAKKPPANPPRPPGPGPRNDNNESPEAHAIEVTKAIERGFQFVKANPHRETYALSLLLLALDAYAAPRWERTAMARMNSVAKERYKYPRRLSDAERLWIQQSLDELVEHRFKGLWSYTKNPGTGDVSNTQFALLGMRAAANCGFTVDPKIWAESLDYFVKFQDEDGPDVQFPMLRSSIKPGATIEVVSVGAKQRSWGYSFARGGPAPNGKNAPQNKPKDKPVFGWSFGATGTHSAIGVASLQIARDEINRILKIKPNAELREMLRTNATKIDRAMRDGVGWLAGNWNLEEDPGGGFPFYYLYSVERVGALLGERFLGGHDWYREGAEILLRRQLKDGAWPSDMGEVNAFGSPDVTTTSFALLFLRRATMPGVITPDFGEGRPKG
jgi:hypothetical protein